MELEEAVACFLHQAQTNLENDKSLEPFIFFLNEEDDLTAMPCPMLKSPQGRALLSVLVAKLAERFKAEVVMCVAEAWVTVVSIDPVAKVKVQKGERGEAVIISAKHRSGKELCVAIGFKRTEEGDIKFDDDIRMSPILSDGLFDEVFPHSVN